MAASHTVALLGFSAFERSTLETCFRLSLQRDQSYELAGSIEGSELLIADCDQADVLRSIGNAGRMQDTVFVGGRQPPGSAGAHLPRPIDALAVQRTLDSLLARRAVRNWPTALERRSPRPSGRLRHLAGQARRVLDFRSSVGFSNSVLSGPERLRNVLVVSPSPAEQLLLCTALEPLGYKPVCCNSGSNAVQLAGQSSFAFVFLGMALGSGMAFHTCKEIKQLRKDDAPGLGLLGSSTGPAVVMMARAGNATDRARATLSGCDGFLTEPIDNDELRVILARHDNFFERGFEPTAMQAMEQAA
jgi:CheY-like chemotaxis protein